MTDVSPFYLYIFCF